MASAMSRTSRHAAAMLLRANAPTALADIEPLLEVPSLEVPQLEVPLLEVAMRFSRRVAQLKGQRHGTRGASSTGSPRPLATHDGAVAGGAAAEGGVLGPEGAPVQGTDLLCSSCLVRRPASDFSASQRRKGEARRY